MGTIRFSCERPANCESWPQWPGCTLCGDMVWRRAYLGEGGGEGCQKLVKLRECVFKGSCSADLSSW